MISILQSPEISRKAREYPFTGCSYAPYVIICI